jgi:ribonuclease HI
MSKTLIKKGDTLKIYTDGAARGNPGPAAISFVFLSTNNIIHKGSEFIGEATNNIAEYKAISYALRSAEKFHKGHLKLYSDSNLVINQINKKWKVNFAHLSKLRNEIYQLSLKYEKVEFFQVGRDNFYIEICDKMCNDKLDEVMK